MILASVNERADYVTQGGEGQVDLRGLFQSYSSRLRLALTLGASKIHQVEFTSFEALFSLRLLKVIASYEDV